MTEPIIKIRNLQTSYGKRKILKGIDLDIYPYETLVILGRSGCGKSTLLRHIVGLNKPDAGEIIIKGTDIVTAGEDEQNEVLKKIGMLFQNGALFNSMRRCIPQVYLTPLLRFAGRRRAIIEL